MNFIPLILLIATLVVEAFGFLTRNGDAMGLAFTIAFLGAGISLLMFAQRSADQPFRKGFLLIALGYIVRGIGELLWLVNIFSDDAPYSFVANLPYYLSSIAYFIGAFYLYQPINRILKTGYGWVFAAVVVSFLISFAFSFGGFNFTNLQLEDWIEWIDNVISGAAGFLVIFISILAMGGIWSTWTRPLAAAFMMFLIGNSWYTVISQNYEYGRAPDLFWLLETVILMGMAYFFGIRQLPEDDF